MSEINSDSTIAEIVSSNYKTADVFKSHGIDFCCGGKISLEKACSKNGLDLNEISQELNSIISVTKSNENFNEWELDFLIDYITNTHHKYVEKSIVQIQPYADKVAAVHGAQHPEVIEISELFKEISNELIPHLKKEELILFPNVKRMVNSKRNNEVYKPAPFGSVNNPISAMEHEHDGAGDIIKKIAELSNNYKTPSDACNTYQVLFSKLEEFQNDLFQHIHLENNILFPKAKELESELLN